MLITVKRKLVKQGNNALTVTLPSSWTSRFNLKAGNEVEVSEMGENIVISSDVLDNSKKTAIDLSNTDIMLYRILAALYKAGYDEIEIKYSTLKELETAQQTIRDEFIGFEIVEHRKNSFTLKRITKIDYRDFDIMLRRMFLIVKSVHEDMITAIEKEDTDFLRTIVLRDWDVNKFGEFCRRTLNKYGINVQQNYSPVYYIVEELEKIGDSYRDMCKFIIETANYNIDKEIILMLNEINEFFNQFYELYFKFSINKTVEFGKRRYELKEKIMNMLDNDALIKKKSNTRLIMYLNEVLSGLWNMNGALMVSKL